VDWIQRTRDSDQWPAVVNTVMNTWVLRQKPYAFHALSTNQLIKQASIKWHTIRCSFCRLIRRPEHLIGRHCGISRQTEGHSFGDHLSSESVRVTPSSVTEASIVLCSVSLWLVWVNVQSACALNTRSIMFCRPTEVKCFFFQSTVIITCILCSVLYLVFKRPWISETCSPRLTWLHWYGAWILVLGNHFDAYIIVTRITRTLIVLPASTGLHTTRYVKTTIPCLKYLWRCVITSQWRTSLRHHFTTFYFQHTTGTEVRCRTQTWPFFC
jgi:hypothetical protein